MAELDLVSKMTSEPDLWDLFNYVVKARSVRQREIVENFERKGKDKEDALKFLHWLQEHNLINSESGSISPPPSPDFVTYYISAKGLQVNRDLSRFLSSTSSELAKIFSRT